MVITEEKWGLSPEGKNILLYTVTNSKGASVKLSNIGAGIVSINVPNKLGELVDVALGYEDALSYFADGPCAGKCPGRYANRIAKGHFKLGNREYKLEVNNGPNHLHGGSHGFQNQVWESRIDGDVVEFSYFAQTGEAHYPGNMKTVVRYKWTEENALELDFKASTDELTIVNLTNHCYFNLNGKGDILEHTLQLNADKYLPTDDTLIPTGEMAEVAGTPMDFRQAHRIGERIKEDFPALNYGKGYDACYVIKDWEKDKLAKAAELYSETSGIKLEVHTTQVGVQVYTGNWLSGCPKAKYGQTYEDYYGVALECQHFPDSPNRPEFPSTELSPEQEYKEKIIFAFSTK